MSSPTDEQITQLIPFLKNTNPHLSYDELVELAKKMLSSPIAPDNLEDDKPLSVLMAKEDKDS